jgi:predicted ATPase with chaperone activity
MFFQCAFARNQVDAPGRSLLPAAMKQLQMSPRAYAPSKGIRHILKLARTIADLAGGDAIQMAHPSHSQDRPGGRDPLSAKKTALIL